MQTLEAGVAGNIRPLARTRSRQQQQQRGRRRVGGHGPARAQRAQEHERPPQLVPQQAAAEEPRGAEAGGSAEDVAERCAAHPGSRNELWCETCEAAICGHCAQNAGHQAHTVVKLSAAYDDTFEAVEAMQVAMVRSLTETRQRSAVLDEAVAALGAEHAAALEAVARQAQRAGDDVDAAFAQAQAGLNARVDGCREWRGGLEETLRTVQGMVEEFSPAQMVMRRARILALLEAVERARPADWCAPLPAPAALRDLARPGWRYGSLHVPMVLELGRKRGHVRVAGDPFSAHGMVWRVEARRSRGPLGDPCLLVAVSCAEGCDAAAMAVSVHVADSAPGPKAARDQPHQHFRAEESGQAWAKLAAREFTVCSLPALEEAQVLDSSGGVTVHVGVRPASFAELARVQDARIGALEAQVEELRRQQRRDTSDVRGWATSPRVPAGAARMRPAVERFSAAGSPLPSLAPGRQPRAMDSPTLLLAPLAGARGMGLPPHVQLRRSPPELALAASARRRANSSQVGMFGIARGSSNPSQVSVAQSQPEFSRPPPVADDGRPGSMLRRLSGWVVRARDSRGPHQPKRGRNPPPAAASPPQQPEGGDDDICDWTFLDGTLSPGFLRYSSYSTFGGGGAAGSTSTLPRSVGAPPAIPLPPVPAPPAPVAALAEEAEDDFAFDGAADIEREQALVDARAAAGGAGLLERYDSIVERVDALQLIANTVENSRDGFSESTLRRVSSELGVLRDGRMRRLAEARTQLSGLSPPVPRARPRMASPLIRPQTSCDMYRASNEPPGIATAAGAGSQSPVVTRKKSATFASDFDEPTRLAEPQPSPTLSTRSGSLDRLAGGLLADSLERLDIGSAGRLQQRRASDSSDSSASHQPRAPPVMLNAGYSSLSVDAVRPLPPQPARAAAVEADEPPPATEQLTPQASRRGGILKAGRSRREAPARLPAGDPGGAVDFHTPQGPRRLAECEAGAMPLLAGRVSTSAVARRTLDAVSPAGGRQARSARSLRKCVRFPEEQRLLETIRLIDPQAARSIESRAATAMSPRWQPPPPPPAFVLPAATASADDLSSADLGSAPISPAACDSASSLDDSGSSSRRSEDAVCCATELHTNARGQAVGPNVGSAHSSPTMAAQALGAANCSPSPPLAGIDGDHTHP